MSAKLKKLSEQVIVVTGASSGIGLATAQTAAKQGASVVLAARSEKALKEKSLLLIQRLFGMRQKKTSKPLHIPTWPAIGRPMHNSIGIGHFRIQ